MERELKRNIVHLAFGVIVSIYVLLFSEYAIMATGLLLVAGFIISKLSQRYDIFVFSYFLSEMERNSSRMPGQGVLSFLVGTLFALLFFPPLIVFYSILILAFMDSFNVIVGMAFGRERWYKKKTYEGTFAGFIAAFIPMLFLTDAKIAFSACVMATMVELFSPIDDNMVIPPVVSAFIYFLA